MIIRHLVTYKQRLFLIQKITERIRWNYRIFNDLQLPQIYNTRLSSTSTSNYLGWIIKPIKNLTAKKNHELQLPVHQEQEHKDFQHLKLLLQNKCYDQILQKCDELTFEEVTYVLNLEVTCVSQNCGLIKNLPLSLHKDSMLLDADLDLAKTSINFTQDLVNRLPKFQKNLESYQLWIHYHNNNPEKVVESYLSIPHPDESAITYLLNSFIVNYEIEIFKSFYQKIIISTQYQLSSNLFHTLVDQLILHGCLFENIFYMYQLWVNSPKTEPPKPESIALLLYQFYKFGTYHEIKEFKRSINRNYGQHYLVRSVLIQNEIINREFTSLKKNFTDDDYNIIENIMPNDPKNLEEFSNHWLQFMVKYSDLEHVNYIIRLYKDKIDDKVPISFFESLLNYYERHDQFIPLLKLIENSIDQIPYKNKYLLSIVKTFIYSYSRFSPSFIETLNTWLNKPNFFKITKLSSQFYPYHLKLPLNVRKYKNWSEIKFKGSRIKNEEQVRFRIDQGFPVLLQQGVYPDFKEVLDTFRMGDLEDRLYIKSMFLKTRQYNWKNQKTLELRSLKHPSLNKEHLKQYFNSNKNSLNDSHKFYFIRMLINFELNEEAKYLINSIDNYNLNDKNKMLKFIMEMRLYFKLKNFKKMIEIIDTFPLNQIYLSPYLLTQSIYIENMIANNLRKKHSKLNQNEIELGWKCVKKLRSFIGEIRLILKTDEEKIPILIEQTINILTKWKQTTNNCK
ncbi:uncharacterized protein KGF55_004732 [Candida pseudojiufengensis]|uniref:uncharacterized protein n=1 Tax=Candida pseudojiufengensis TaxID=497109 RepID=UPI00222479A5|nr:uncharacterized protein KGF55_004732 [Candida pseudojiufengensis]KAI5960439.1 hypothetical protein KGF55_004732 [Candida pseudojiufengensis]